MTLKRTTLALVATGAFLVCGSPLWAQTGTKPSAAKLPRIEVSETRFDFGRVAQGSSISHVFWLKNVGADTLRITDVKPG